MKKSTLTTSESKVFLALPGTRAELMEKTGLSEGTIASVLARLTAAEVVRASGRLTPRALGRPATVYELVATPITIYCDGVRVPFAEPTEVRAPTDPLFLAFFNPAT
jgi:predicted ArsR family transcriptional regulator